MKEVRIIGIILLILFYPLTVIASWSEPDEIVKGGWGKGEKEFGFRPGDIKDQIPWNFLLLFDDKIVIEDWLNNRLKLYLPTGAYLKSIVQPGIGLYELDSEKIVSFKWNAKLKKRNIGIYSIMKEKWLWVDHANSFKYVSNIELEVLNRNIFIWDGKNGYQYSPTGQLLKTYKERPLELGVVKEKRLGNKRYKVTIKYPDKEWVVISKGACRRYVRDLNCNLYCPGHRQVIKYDEDGNEAARLTMPERIADEFPGVGPGVEAAIEVKEEYGPPVVSPNGDVYTWKRTPDTYSIIKWTWQGPPDAPQSLKVSSLKTGLNLTWKPPLEGAKAVKEYEIVRSDEMCGQFSSIVTVPQNTLKYEDKDVSEGTTYRYKVSAIKHTGSSKYSNKAACKR